MSDCHDIDAGSAGIKAMQKARQTEIHFDQAIHHLFYRDLQIEEIDTAELQALLETVQAEVKYRTTKP